MTVIRPRRLRFHAACVMRWRRPAFVHAILSRRCLCVRARGAGACEVHAGVFQLSVDTAVEELKRLEKLGWGVHLVGVTDAAKKDATGSYAHNPDNEVCGR